MARSQSFCWRAKPAVLKDSIKSRKVSTMMSHFLLNCFIEDSRWVSMHLLAMFFDEDMTPSSSTRFARAASGSTTAAGRRRAATTRGGSRRRREGSSARRWATPNSWRWRVVPPHTAAAHRRRRRPPWRRPAPNWQHCAHRDDLTVDLASVHVLHCFFRINVIFEFHVSRCPWKGAAFGRHVHSLDFAVVREDLHDVFLDDVLGQAGHVKLGGLRCRAAVLAANGRSARRSWTPRDVLSDRRAAPSDSGAWSPFALPWTASRSVALGRSGRIVAGRRAAAAWRAARRRAVAAAVGSRRIACLALSRSSSRRLAFRFCFTGFHNHFRQVSLAFNFSKSWNANY